MMQPEDKIQEIAERAERLQGNRQQYSQGCDGMNYIWECGFWMWR